MTLCRVTPEVLAQMADVVFKAMKAGAATAEPGSYNAVLTRQHLHFIPRLKERSGPVACNALVSPFCALGNVLTRMVFVGVGSSE